ncbi:stearoyl-CoA desaturase-like [Haliotis rufescens]|uniref:stearoyl-CoA desaturase-like n=1 Tax=Haliotis rufescens TaxID=6454 RepID=UPI001EAFE277|nr:stearoyl-CoA desaturase-like [Haliotis rufescens]
MRNTMSPRQDVGEAGLSVDPNPRMKAEQETTRPPMVIVWRNVFLSFMMNALAVYALTLIPKAMWRTTLWGYAVLVVTDLGITAGVHRLWAHRSYKARFPLKVLLAIFQTGAFQNSIFEWSRDHRVHHKYSDTDGDPHNATRGFFFSHIGWLMVKKHPDVIAKGKQLDMSDLLNDKVVMFQKRYYVLLVGVFWFAIPSLVPCYFWGETFYNSVHIAVFLRYCLGMHTSFLVNSYAHLRGMRPYDEKIRPADNYIIALIANGEGFHNFHHTFPQDYATSELPWTLNLTSVFIDACAKLGLAYDLNKTSKDIVAKRAARTGQGSLKG